MEQYLTRDFYDLVTKYRTKVWNIAYQLLQDRDEADDACQEVFYRVLRQLPGFRRESHPYTWIYRITINYCNDVLRKRSRLHCLPLDEVDPGPEDAGTPGNARSPGNSCSKLEGPEERTERNELVHALKDALGRLPANYRECIILRVIQQLSYKEISQVLGVPVGTVMSRLHYGKRRLREMLRPFLEGD